MKTGIASFLFIGLALAVLVTFSTKKIWKATVHVANEKGTKDVFTEDPNVTRWHAGKRVPLYIKEDRGAFFYYDLCLQKVHIPEFAQDTVVYDVATDKKIQVVMVTFDQEVRI